MTSSRPRRGLDRTGFPVRWASAASMRAMEPCARTMTSTCLATCSAAAVTSSDWAVKTLRQCSSWRLLFRDVGAGREAESDSTFLPSSVEQVAPRQYAGGIRKSRANSLGAWNINPSECRRYIKRFRGSPSPARARMTPPHRAPELPPSYVPGTLVRRARPGLARSAVRQQLALFACDRKSGPCFPSC